MNYKLLKYLVVILIFLSGFVSVLAEGQNKNNNNSLSKSMGTPKVVKFNINNISTFLYSDGRADINGNNSGFTYPKGSNKQPIYQSGFLYMGKVNNQVRMNGAVFQSGSVDGKIGQDANAADNRMFRVRPDWETGSVATEVSEGEGDAETVRAQYKKDWDEWPWQDGAPYEDVNKDGKYDPKIDIPGIVGADQTIFCIYNAANSGKAQGFYASPAMEVEVHATVWGYKVSGPLYNMLFKKFELFNKGVDDITECYVAQWADPDVGNAGDDFVGCDTTLSLGFAYNAQPFDATYLANPPAAGFDFFQGPIVPGALTDTARVSGKKIPGYKNLPQTAFFYFVNENNTDYSDPVQDNYDTGTLRFWNLVQGKMPRSGTYYPIPESVGGGTTKYPLSGDPVKGTGYVDGIIKEKADRRLGLSSGPFLLKAGDKQEIVVAQIAAGGVGGVNNLQAVTLLKSYDQIAQKAYDSNFDVAKAPSIPEVKVTELNQKIVLNWANEYATAQKIEGYSQGGYNFEGYKVYQLPTPSASISDGKLLKVYDKVNEITFIFDEEFDPATGAVKRIATQVGGDFGLERTLTITKDELAGTGNLINGKKYYFGVSTYVYSPDPVAIPKALESELTRVTVIPHDENPGVIFPVESGKKITTTKDAGTGEGTLDVTVINPELLNDHKYEVTFATLNGETVWNLTDKNTGKVRIENSKSYKTGVNSPVADGMLVDVRALPGLSIDYDDILLNGKSLTADHGNSWWTDATKKKWILGSYTRFASATGTMADGFTFGVGTRSVSKLQNDIELRFTGVMGDTTVDGVTYRYIKSGGQMATVWSVSFAGGLAAHPLNAARTNAPFLMRIPFEVWDVVNNKQINIMVRQREGATTDAQPQVWNYNNNKRMYCDIVGTPYKAEVIPTDSPDLENEGLWTICSYYTDYNVGDKILLKINNPVQPNADKFSFTAPKALFDLAEAQNDVEKINVFPNPYYGVNTQEINKYQRFVTFNHLPKKATIRIFNLASQQVAKLNKDDASQFIRWDLKNQDAIPVGSGLYIAYIDMPEIGKTKILKFSIIQEQQILDRY